MRCFDGWILSERMESRCGCMSVRCVRRSRCMRAIATTITGASGGVTATERSGCRWCSACDAATGSTSSVQRRSTERHMGVTWTWRTSRLISCVRRVRGVVWVTGRRQGMMGCQCIVIMLFQSLVIMLYPNLVILLYPNQLIHHSHQIPRTRHPPQKTHTMKRHGSKSKSERD